MNLQLRPLMELMDEALAGTGSHYTAVAEFIEGSENAKNSQDFIDQLMQANTIDNFPRKSNLPLSRVYLYPQERARHIAISFLFGMVLSEFCGFYASLPEVLNRGNDAEQTQAALSQRMWLITSLSHDNGYALKELSDGKLDLEKEYPRFLLTDTYNDLQMESIQNFATNYPSVFAHNYEQILAYNGYIRKYKDWDPPHEVNDHGVLGGLNMFNHLTHNMDNLPSPEREHELTLIKACCLTVAQHNIFKSLGQAFDNNYLEFKLDHLLSTSDFRIDRRTPLLLFLCLVDTIECMKRFSKGATNSSYLQATTILQKIHLHVDSSKIVLDFSLLKKHIDEREKRLNEKDKELTNRYKGYLNTLKSFHTWTVFKGQADPENENIITITLDQ